MNCCWIGHESGSKFRSASTPVGLIQPGGLKMLVIMLSGGKNNRAKLMNIVMPQPVRMLAGIIHILIG